MEILNIINKTIEDNIVKIINWSYDISNEYVESYQIQGAFEVKENLVYDNDENLITYLETKLDIEGFKKQCYIDLQINI